MSTAGQAIERTVFLLGGRDLEMLEIRRLLETHGAAFVDKGLAWGARLSDYASEIEAALAAGQTPVAVELIDDMPPDWSARDHVVVIDHHGEGAGANRPCSLQQVFEQLGLPRDRWTRRMALVAANDIGHVAGLEHMGATRGEIIALRAEDRAAQRVTAQDEAEAEHAIAARRVRGRLTIVQTLSSTSSAIADRMLPLAGGPGYEALLVVMLAKVAVYADGDAIARLSAAFPGSWHGGALPARGFWGANVPPESDRRQAMIDSIVALVR